MGSNPPQASARAHDGRRATGDGRRATGDGQTVIDLMQQVLIETLDELRASA